MLITLYSFPRMFFFFPCSVLLSPMCSLSHFAFFSFVTFLFFCCILKFLQSPPYSLRLKSFISCLDLFFLVSPSYKVLSSKSSLGWIQDLVKGGSNKLSPTLSNCYCCLASRSFTRKSMVKIFAFVSR